MMLQVTAFSFFEHWTVRMVFLGEQVRPEQLVMPAELNREVFLQGSGSDQVDLVAAVAWAVSDVLEGLVSHDRKVEAHDHVELPFRVKLDGNGEPFLPEIMAQLRSIFDSPQ